MKRFISVIMIAVFLSCVSGAGYCDTPLIKLGRGAANVLTCWGEGVSQVKKANENSGAVGAVTYGPIVGAVMIVFRAVVGVYEIVTFPIPFPDQYKPILTDPEYFLESDTW